MILTDEQLASLARLVAETAAKEIDCDEMLLRAAAFVEAIAEGPADIPEAFREVAQHLRVCPECREEVDLLLEATHDSPDSPESA